MDSFKLTKLAFRGLKGVGKGALAVGKAGLDAYGKYSNEQFKQVALNEIHSIIFPGAVLTPGHPLPPLRAVPLNPDEVDRFTKACNGLIKRKIPLPNYASGFAKRIYIELKQPK